jgi:hypothetical protein
MAQQASSLNHRLASYFHDCLAAQTDWAGSVNVFGQKDVAILPLSGSEQQHLNVDGRLSLKDEEAVEFGKRAALMSSDLSLTLGALFLVGRLPAQDAGKYKQLCAPIIEVPLEISESEGGGILVRVSESDFTVNHSLLAEIFQGEDDDLQDRLADLSERVPDFPIDENEIETFWERFQMIAPELPLKHELPAARRNQSERIDKNADGPDKSETERGCETDLIDFYLPQAAKDDFFRILPATAIVLGNKTGHAMSALNELRMMQDMDLSKTAFGCLFDPDTAVPWTIDSHERTYPDEVRPLPLTPAQAAIVESARSAPLTVVTGPPGTGKSYTIAAIMLDAMLNGQTVLLASQMDKAVEVVAKNVENRAGPLSVARSGGRKTQRELAAKITKLTGPKNNLGYSSHGTVQECAESHFELTRQSQDLADGFGKSIRAEERWSKLHEDCTRSEPLLPFESRTVTTKRLKKANRIFERSQRNGGPGKNIMKKWWSRWDRSRVTKILELSAAEQAVEDSDIQLMLNFYTLQHELEGVERRLKHPFVVDLVWGQILELKQQRHQCALDLLRMMRERRLKKLIDNQQNRTALRNLSKLLRRRDRKLKTELKREVDHRLLTDAFPGWASTNRALCEVLPTSPALFDVVVIDEASQCDLALAGVALMRGKRAVVVGDPNQLRHVCFLSRTREQAYCVKNDLDEAEQRRFHFRRSLFDVAADAVEQQHFFLLDEHFRSHPHIINFSNEKFYDGDLKIMTGRPGNADSAIELREVKGHREADSSVNLAEVDDTVQQVVRFVESSQGGRPLSIGVVSPFRDHADEIQRRVIETFSSDVILRHGMTVGTAHALQGDEKDVVIMTTSIDEDSHRGSLQFLETPNLFNVAITRARKLLVVVTSVKAAGLRKGLLKDFLVYANNPGRRDYEDARKRSPFERQLGDQLKKDGIEVWPDFDATGTRVPMIAGREGSRVAVMYDAHSTNPAEPWVQLEEQLRLARAGWNVTRIPHRTFVGNPKAVTTHVSDRLTDAAQ